MTNSKSAQYGDGGFGSSSSIRNRLLYLFVGGGIGAAVALLFAPKSGSDLRGDISEISKKKFGETKELAGNLKQQSTDLYQKVKEKADGVYDFAANKLTRAQNQVGSAVDQGADRVNAEMLELESKAAQKQTGTGRRSTSIV